MPAIHGYPRAGVAVNLARYNTNRIPMRRGLPLFESLFVFVTCSGVCAAAPPDSIFVCTDADGHRTYQNSADGPSCRRADGLLATIPSTELSRAAARRSMAREGISPASFPRVDINTQRLRDSDRRRILQEELRTEEERLAQLRTDFNNGRPQPSRDEAPGSERYRGHVQHLFEDIERSEANIASLRRELTPARF